jgi:hypothetical protein
MRIIAIICKFLLLFLILFVVGFFISKEVFLFLGVGAFKNSLTTLNKAHAGGKYTLECQRMGSKALPGEKLVTYQLKFLNSHDYVLEAVCNRFDTSPIVFERATLPAMVTKVAGKSGIIWADLYKSGVELAVYQDLAQRVADELHVNTSFMVKTKSIVVNDRIAEVVRGGLMSSELGDGPVTSCQGYGFECCQSTSQMGSGEQIVGLRDCSENCYSKCSPRPTILSFTSNPYFDSQVRSVEVVAGETVEFLFVSDSSSDAPMTATLDFGDGIQTIIEESQGLASHSYECEAVSCQYTAILSLRDGWGAQSAASSLSRIDVVVKNESL